jgi:hypothetical protein
MHPNPGNLRRGRRGGSLRVFRQFAWLGVGSVKIALSRPSQHPHQGAIATGTPAIPTLNSRGRMRWGGPQAVSPVRIWHEH